MGVPTSEVGYTSAINQEGDHEVHDGHVVALDKQKSVVTIAKVTDDHVYISLSIL
jgi:hypothetical protein